MSPAAHGVGELVAVCKQKLEQDVLTFTHCDSSQTQNLPSDGAAQSK